MTMSFNRFKSGDPKGVIGNLANSADQDQTPQNAESDHGLHCLQIDYSFSSRNVLIT